MTTQKIVGIIGSPLTHSLSPYVHNACFNEMSMNWQYVPFEIGPDVLGSLLSVALESNICGFNVTMPYKEAAIRFLDGLSPEAEKIQAVNTIKIDNGRAVGYNTDAYAISRVLKDSYGHLNGKSVVVLGAGGVAKAAAYSVITAGCERLTIVNRSQRSAEKMVELFRGDLAHLGYAETNGLTDILKSTDIIINATPAGMYPNEEAVPLDVNCLEKGQFVLDLIYHPAETRLLSEAKQRGLSVTGGVPVFVYQAKKSFAIWTGMEPPVETMEKVIEDKLRER